MTSILVAVYLASLFGMAIYGLLGYLTLGLYLRHRKIRTSIPAPEFQTLPPVTVQLPVFNERDVVERLIEAAVGLDYPCDRLEIQVLDDSTDDTTELAIRAIAAHQARGVNIVLLHRDERLGFKAGALQAALTTAAGEFIAIFDADFVPAPDFLLRTVPYLLADDLLGAVQARWGHMNSRTSALTQAQAIALDKHFAVEQLVRFRADLFPKFNGSAGVWRRACIEEVGGWQADTVCEDLCLSTRAVLAGWRFHFADEVIAPAELPASVLAYKIQQARWAMGATQCLTKYAGQIWRAEAQSPLARFYSLLSLAAYGTQVLLLLIVLLQLPLILTGYQLPGWLFLLGLIGLGQPILFALAQQALHPDWTGRLRFLPVLLVIAIGVAPSNARAVLSALFGRNFTFARTPKGTTTSYSLPAGRFPFIELSLMVYSALSLYLAVAASITGPVMLLGASCIGFGYVAIRGLSEGLSQH